MTTKVALQATKRRKMGYDVDYFNDSGVPMDGIELDSSSTSTSNVTRASLIAQSVGSEPVSSIGVSQSDNHNVNSSRTNEHSQITDSTVGTTNQQTNARILSNTMPTNSNTSSTSSATAATSASASIISSSPDKVFTASQPNHAESMVTSENRNETRDQIATISMTSNEAMTNDDPSQLSYVHEDNDLRFSNQNSPDYGHPQNDYRMNEDSCLSYEDRQQHQSSSSNGNAHQNLSEARKSNKEKPVLIRSFGDLFDDDDLD